MQKPRIRVFVRDAYEKLLPLHRGGIARVLSPGSNLREWVIKYGDGIGRARTKKEARMISLVRCHIDPEFTGDAPVRNVDRYIAEHEASQNRRWEAHCLELQEVFRH